MKISKCLGDDFRGGASPIMPCMSLWRKDSIAGGSVDLIYCELVFMKFVGQQSLGAASSSNQYFVVLQFWGRSGRGAVTPSSSMPSMLPL